MGQTIETLSSRKLAGKGIFPTRFCIEICEKVHVHHKNLRFVHTLHDFVKIAEGFRDGLDRWKRRGCPGTNANTHIELTRKEIIFEGAADTVQINLNKNLYKENEGKIFAEGANITDGSYIHVKFRDARVEMTVDEFKEFSDAIIEAKARLEGGSVVSSLPTRGLHGEVIEGAERA